MSEIERLERSLGADFGGVDGLVDGPDPALAMVIGGDWMGNVREGLVGATMLNKPSLEIDGRGVVGTSSGVPIGVAVLLREPARLLEMKLMNLLRLGISSATGVIGVCRTSPDGLEATESRDQREDRGFSSSIGVKICVAGIDVEATNVAASCDCTSGGGVNRGVVVASVRS